MDFQKKPGISGCNSTSIPSAGDFGLLPPFPHCPQPLMLPAVPSLLLSLLLTHRAARQGSALGGRNGYG